MLQYYPANSEVKELHSTIIANCVFNNFLCYTAIMLNIVTIQAIRKTVSLPKTLKTLFLSLAVSDVGVGLLAQPLYTSLLVRWIKQNDAGCNTYKIFDIMMGLLSVVSFFLVVAVSIDRLLAIHLHLRYQELVTHRRVVAVVISIWTLSAFLFLIMLWVPQDINSLIVTITGVSGLFLTILVYIRIYLVVRRHKNQIRALQEQQVGQTDEMADFISLVKSAAGIFYVYLVFLLCYLPHFICLAVIEINGPSIALKRFYLFSVTLLYLNSSLNPVIYCWKMRHIRHAIMDILRNMSWHRNQASH